MLPYRNSFISYYRFGRGPVAVICFHGYGESAQSFQFLGERLGKRYSFHAIDLPFHGETKWNDGLEFRNHDLIKIISLLNLPSNQRPLLLGYSLGGRVSLSLYQQQPSAFNKMVLLAPDGLLENPWYWFSTQTFVGNRLFRFTMKHPGWFFFLLKIMNRTGRVNASVFKFVNAYIGNPDVRRILYQRWTALRKLRPDIPKVKSMVRQQNTSVTLLYGKYDRIILPARGEKFCRDLDGLCSITILNAGHQLLQEKYTEEIADALG